MINNLTAAKKRGLSLIEVMASLLIMGTLVAAMLTSMAGSIRQMSTAEAQLRASHIARELLAEWNLKKEDLTASSSGTVDALSEWSWTRSAQKREVVPGFTVSEITLAIARTADGSQLNSWQQEFKVWVHNPPMGESD